MTTEQRITLTSATATTATTNWPTDDLNDDGKLLPVLERML
jgi:hypothetical protein